MEITPHDAIKKEFFKPSERDLHTTCPWKGVANYYDVELPDGLVIPDAAWFYPNSKAKDLDNKVAFYKNKGIRVE
ncbi:hypothetical protein OIO90_005007 [Microbotryomycetes sp. JL221]|nr:hypothetical protein OIO90_005007 [Microbotryomycetes sp. JL221]